MDHEIAEPFNKQKSTKMERKLPIYTDDVYANKYNAKRTQMNQCTNKTKIEHR